MKKLAVVIGALTAAASFADVPHSFQAGTPAKASEVNANFSALNSDINTALSEALTNAADIEGAVERISSLEQRPSQCPDQYVPGTYYHSLSYEPKTAAVGDQITIEGKLYRMVQVPFVEYGSGNVYSIKYPAPVVNEGEGAGDQFQIYHQRPADGCFSTNISGWPAYIGTQEYRYIGFEVGSTGGAISFQRIVAIQLNITVNESRLYFSTYTGAHEGNATTNPEDYDLSDDVDTTKMAHDDNWVVAFDEMIDYIEIVEAP